MMNYPDVPNFIFCDCKYDMSRYKTQTQEYYSHSSFYHRLAVKRVKQLYPDSKFHVIVNTENHGVMPGLIYHYLPNVEPNNYCKLAAYELLDEPAMFIDNDVLMVRRFTEEELRCDNEFNLYRPCPKNDRQRPEIQDQQYNSGVVWITRPSKRLASELNSMKDQFRIYESGWVNDEFVLSKYIHDHGWNLNLIRTVNQFRYNISRERMSEFQTLHYTGVESKMMFAVECGEYLNIRMNL